MALILVAILGLLAVVIAEAGTAGAAQRDRYQSRLAALDAELHRAAASGYTTEDLAPVTVGRENLTSRAEPIWVGELDGFYRTQASHADELLDRLRHLESNVHNQEQDAADARLKDASDRISEDQALGADEAEVTTLRAKYDSAVRARTDATTLTELRAAVREAEAVAGQAAEAAAAQKAEVATIQQAADGLKQQVQGDLGSIQKAGRDALAAGRNDATAGTWLKASGFDLAYARLEKQAPSITAGEVDKAAFAAASAQRYAGQIHDAVIKGMPRKAILLSMQGQELWAYENGQVVQDTLVTTGRPPNLATDMGPMKVLRKDSPWKMHSPWPEGSPYWYPDTVVQMVVWFTVTGEGLHDAYWQSTPYGPGSQYGPSASHGCVHVPYSSERFLYNWAEIGTPVVIYPGDGSPVADQLKQKTTDDDGSPLTGPKGA